MAHSTNIKWINSTNILAYLEKFAEEFYRRYGGSVRLSVNIFGGSALLIKHPEFRAGTVDIDTYIRTVPDIDIKQFILEFAKFYGIPYDWMNEDLCKSPSFSIRLNQRTFVYKTLYNCVELRLVTDSDQLCMKVIAGRNKDRDDIVGLAKSLRGSGFSYSDFVSTMQVIYGPDAMSLAKSRSLALVKRLLR